MAKLPALPYVRSGVSRDLSANAAYRRYQSIARAEGLQSTRRQDFLRLYSETRASRANVGDAMNRPKDTIPGADEVAQRTTVNARGYGQWVMIYQRTSRESDFIRTPFLVKSHQPITPAEAEAKALGFTQLDTEAYNRVVIGVGYVGTEQFNPQQGA